MASLTGSEGQAKNLATRVFPHAVMFRHQLKEVDHYLDWLSNRQGNGVKDIKASIVSTINDLTEFNLHPSEFSDHMKIVADIDLLIRIHKKAAFVGVEAQNLISTPLYNCIDVLYETLYLKGQTEAIDIVNELMTVKAILPTELQNTVIPVLEKAKVGIKPRAQYPTIARPAPQPEFEDSPLPARKRSRESLQAMTAEESDGDQNNNKENRPPPRKRRRFSIQPMILKPGHQLYQARGPDEIRTYSISTDGGITPHGLRPLPPVSPGAAAPRSLTAKSFREEQERLRKSSLQVDQGGHQTLLESEMSDKFMQSLDAAPQPTQRSTNHPNQSATENAISINDVQAEGKANDTPASSSTEIFEDDTVTPPILSVRSQPDLPPASGEEMASLDDYRSPDLDAGTMSGYYSPTSPPGLTAPTSPGFAAKSIKDHGPGASQGPRGYDNRDSLPSSNYDAFGGVDRPTSSRIPGIPAAPAFRAFSPTSPSYSPSSPYFARLTSPGAVSPQYSPASPTALTPDLEAPFSQAPPPSGSIGFASPFDSATTQYLSQNQQPFRPADQACHARGESGSSTTLSDHDPYSLNHILNPMNPVAPFDGKAKPAAAMVDLAAAEGEESDNGGRDSPIVASLKADVRRLNMIMEELAAEGQVRKIHKIADEITAAAAYGRNLGSKKRGD